MSNLKEKALGVGAVLLTVGATGDNAITDLISSTASSGLTETSNILDTPIGKFLFFAIGVTVLFFAVPFVVKTVKYVRRIAK